MTTKERIQMIRDAIKAIKAKSVKAVSEGRLIDFSNLMLDLGGLEQCLDIETDIALKELSAFQCPVMRKAA